MVIINTVGRLQLNLQADASNTHNRPISWEHLEKDSPSCGSLLRAHFERRFQSEEFCACFALSVDLERWYYAIDRPSGAGCIRSQAELQAREKTKALTKHDVDRRAIGIG